MKNNLEKLQAISKLTEESKAVENKIIGDNLDNSVTLKQTEKTKDKKKAYTIFVSEKHHKLLTMELKLKGSNFSFFIDTIIVDYCNNNQLEDKYKDIIN